MKYIKENLILFELCICLLIAGVFSLFSFDKNTPLIILIIGLLSLIIGILILWKGFILKIIKGRNEV
jgi:xanthosine utilization system XapX-like protein